MHICDQYYYTDVHVKVVLLLALSTLNYYFTEALWHPAVTEQLNFTAETHYLCLPGVHDGSACDWSVHDSFRDSSTYHSRVGLGWQDDIPTLHQSSSCSSYPCRTPQYAGNKNLSARTEIPGVGPFSQAKFPGILVPRTIISAGPKSP